MTQESQERKAYLQIMDAYLEALVRKNLTMAPLREDCRITFNGKEQALGDNFLWANTLYSPQRQAFVDTVSGNVMLLGIATNEWQNFQGNDPPPQEGDGALSRTYRYPFYALTVIRLHIREGKIDQVEELFEDKRYMFMRTSYSDIRLPELMFDIPVPQEERMTREELRHVTDLYWDCIAKKKPASALLLHPECRRIENGMCCTHNHGTFRNEFTLPSFTWDTPQEKRFYPIIDPARGIVLSMQGFVEVEGSDPGNKNPYIIDLFKIENGLIRQITAFMIKDMTELGWQTAAAAGGI